MPPLWTSTMQDLIRPEALLARLGVAFGLAIVVALTYRHTRAGHEYSRSFMVTLLGTSVVMTMVMSVVSCSLALSLGMFGAVPVIRFRTAVQDSRDLTYLFPSIAIGLACAVTDFVFAICGALTVCGMLYVTHHMLARLRPAQAGTRLTVRLSIGAQPDQLPAVVRRLSDGARLLECSHAKKGWTYVFLLRCDPSELPKVAAGLREHFENIERVHLSVQDGSESDAPHVREEVDVTPEVLGDVTRARPQ